MDPQVKVVPPDLFHKLPISVLYPPHTAVWPLTRGQIWSDAFVNTFWQRKNKLMIRWGRLGAIGLTYMIVSPKYIRPSFIVSLLRVTRISVRLNHMVCVVPEMIISKYKHQNLQHSVPLKGRIESGRIFSLPATSSPGTRGAIYAL